MKKVLAVALASLMVMSLSACGSSSSSTTTTAAPAAGGSTTTTAAATAAPAESSEPIELEFIQWWAAENGGPVLDELVAGFEAENPNITIKLTTLPFGETRNQVIASKASKSVPDLIAMNPPWAREFYDLGILAPLDDLIAADENYNKEDYMQASYAPIEGNSYLAPVNTMAFYLFYNKTMFEEAGLEPPTTWEEMVTAADILTDVDKNQYGIAMSMSEQEASNGSILTLYPLLYAQNGRTVVDGKFTVDTEEMYNALKFLEDLATNGSYLPGGTSRSEVQNMESFSVGNVGMLISHDGHILTISERNPDLDFGIIPIPTYDGTGKAELRHHGWDIAISENCENKEAAWKFISYISQKEQVEMMCNDMLKLPTRYDADVEWTVDYPIVNDALSYLQEYEMVEELMLMPSSSACWVELTKAGAAIVQGNMTAEEAVTSVQAAWDKTLGQ